ncbi:amino acid adenylation domain-containing protein, partial [uncultured Chitinophaga sp.]|uniref:non-ribosomal peptide synthetase n=1 Tax=uncultured Chitinophaga sp. TaxID=339340 RepID=UPI002637A0A2
NATHRSLPQGKTILDLFEEQAALTPEATAMVFEQTIITYRQLNELANQLSHYLLQQHHIQPEDLTGIHLQRSEWVVIAILAVLKAGGAYVPADPQYPQERIDYIFSDARCKVVIDQAILDDFNSKRDLYSSRNLQCSLQPAQLAYVIYTSGSTGKPKGVMITHHSVYAFIKWCQRHFSDADVDIVFAATSVCFDLSIFEIFFPLATGKPFRLLENALAIPAYLKAHRKVLLNTVPSVVGALLRDGADLSTVSVLNMAGEPVPAGYIAQLDLNRMQVWNLYGPSEDTTYSTVYRIQPGSPVLIGTPIDNTRVYILGAATQLLPIGVAGEICLGGDGLAKGYLNNPALTAEKFIPDPFRPGERIYKTGDLGRWTSEGNIEFLGRKDEQVKIRGYRIEPGEIEYCLQTYPRVTDAVVTAKTNQAGEKELAAYLVAKEPLDVAAIKEHLSGRLPSYMLPGHYVQMDALPLNANGKVDKKRLPDPEGISLEKRQLYVAPRNETELRLANIWQDIL